MSAPAPSASWGRLPRWVAWVALLLVLAFAFQGSRGIWEPDEGFYTNVALGMLRGGDWWVPRLDGEPFLDKPPLLYWSAGGAMGLFGVREWAARLPLALAYLGTALALGALAARWWGRRARWITAAIYATTLAPFLAANVITPDTLLAFFVTAAAYLYWRLEDAPQGGRRLARGLAFGACIGLGILTKGPAMLLFAAPFGLHALLVRRSWRVLADVGYQAAAAAALAVALPWYGSMVHLLPGAGAYFLDNQVAGRLVTATYARNAGTFGGLKVYLPTLIAGSLPWSAVGLGWTVRAWRERRSSLRRAPDAARSVVLFLRLWFWFPLAVLLVASSRLPLYALPLFAPLALGVVLRWEAVRTPQPGGGPGGRPRLAPAAWVVLLLVVRAASGWIENPADSRWLAGQLRGLGLAADHPVVTVNTRRSGLAFYGYGALERTTLRRKPYPFFVLPEHLDEEVREIEAGEAPAAFVVKDVDQRHIRSALEQAGLEVDATPLGRGLVVLCAGLAPGREVRLRASPSSGSTLPSRPRP